MESGRGQAGGVRLNLSGERQGFHGLKAHAEMNAKGNPGEKRPYHEDEFNDRD